MSRCGCGCRGPRPSGRWRGSEAGGGGLAVAYACVLCVAARGLKDSEIVSLPQTIEEFRAHLREVHGLTVMDARKSREMFGGMKRLGPGIYSDGAGAIHVRASELLDYLGLPYTLQNEERVGHLLRRVAAERGIGQVEEVLVYGD